PSCTFSRSSSFVSHSGVNPKSLRRAKHKTNRRFARGPTEWRKSMGTAAAGPSHLAIKLKSREQVAEDTMAFRFERPAGWTFKAGQSFDMTLLDPPETDAEGNTRAFSVASAPQEDFLMIATRMRDTAFKRTLKTLELGSTVKIEGPFGNLTLHNNAAKGAGLLAGGIGITPFRSMVFRAAREKL